MCDESLGVLLQCQHTESDGVYKASMDIICGDRHAFRSEDCINIVL